MISNIIIACFVFAAFFRAAREYAKNGLAWGVIGLASFFTPYFAITIFVAMLLAIAGVGGAALAISSLIGFVAAVATVVWVYNKMMERAIDAQAALDSPASASAQPFSDSSNGR